MNIFGNRSIWSDRRSVRKVEKLDDVLPLVSGAYATWTQKPSTFIHRRTMEGVQNVKLASNF